MISIPIPIASVAAVYDFQTHLDPLPARFHEFSVALLPPLFVMGMVLGVYLLLAPIFVFGPRFLYGVPLVPSSTILAIGAALAVTFRPNSPSVTAYLQWLVLACGVMVFLAAAGRILYRKAQREPNHLVFWRRLPLVLMLMSVGVFLLQWLIHFELRDFSRQNPLAVTTVYVLYLTPIVWLLLLPRPRPALQAGLSIVLGLGALSPALTLFSEEHRLLGNPSNALGSRTEIKHVVLIVVDTLRGDSLSYISSQTPATPRIDELAAESVVFEKAIAPAPWTFPSMHSLMTGVAPYLDSRNLTYRTAPLPTWAELFQAAGYYTRGISGNHLLYRPLNVVSGFMEIDTYSSRPLGMSLGARGLTKFWPRTFTVGGITEEVTQDAIQWMRGHKKDPFFLWVHYLDPHDPYAPPGRYLNGDSSSRRILTSRDPAATPHDRARAKLLYDAEVQFVDENVGELLREMRALRIFDDSLIVFVSDHGEEFWDHGRQGHGHSLYQEVLHVPLIFRLPNGSVSRRVRCHVPVQAILPTVLEACGIALPDEEGWPLSLTRFLREGSADAYSEPIVSAATRRGEPRRSVVLQGMKYIVGLVSGREEVYDLRRDPRERFNVLREHPEFVTRARSVLARHEQFADQLRKSHGLGASGSDFSPEMLRRLKSMGYIQ